MTRHLFVFLGTFAAGAVVALAIRASRHEPHQDVTAPAPAEHAAMVGNALIPAETSTKPAADAPSPAGPVNTVCAICGMDVDPKIPTAEYQGKTIGFGCAMCPPKFRANPDKYGPAYLRNAVVHP